MTRTVHYGAPSQHEKECFTRVLKGHIALASAVFPNKTKGHCVDSFARQHLWQVNLIINFPKNFISCHRLDWIICMALVMELVPSLTYTRYIY